MRKTITFLIFFLISWWSCAACAKVYLDINSPAFQKFPVAIPEFKNIGKSEVKDDLSTWLADQLSRSLKITGFFNIIEKDAFLEDQNSAGITAGEIDFSNWSRIGSDFLVKGGFSYNGKTLSVEFRLFDTVEGKLITGKKYWGNPEEKKSMVFKFADEILVALTGGTGVFDTKIAFVGKKEKSSEIYTMNFDGSDPIQITDYNSLTLLPHWSPDASELSFTSYKDGNPDCYIRNLASGKTKKISSFTGLNLPTSWSPDGKKILIVLSKDGNEDIYIKHLDSDKLQRLTDDRAIDVSPAWSPDGKKIAFVSNRSGSPQIFVMDSEGGNIRRLTFDGSYNSSPSWSPDGTRIAYEGSSNGIFQIFSIGEDGTNCMQLTFETGGGESPSWSPDGRYIVFSSMKGGRRRIHVMNSNGLNQRVLPAIKGGASFKSPSWSGHLNFY
ncbi:MAG TPA: Tol-Pal system beta propeller repeat protein TolB [Syntrophales bacterium]|nr:Tol-Pal system beta propeller repeat protein TolB [Syntrophales bacterium]HPQ44188.1 Tol-Pal system beta propeller repeat protein TolB [Syntrophales bacterium]